MWKVCRKLTTAKNMINRELKKNKKAEVVLELKTQRDEILQQIEEEEKKQEHNRIEMIVADRKKAGGVNSNTFWDVRKKITNKGKETAHAIKDKEGKLCVEPEEIRMRHAEWFQELLQTKQGITSNEKEAEDVVNRVWNSIKTLADNQQVRITSKEEVEAVVKDLNPRKAQDTAKWKNKTVKEGGQEMI